MILDWHGEYLTLLSTYNLIDPTKTPLQLFTNDPSDLNVISSVLELTPPQEYILEKVLRKNDAIKVKALEEFLEYVENYPEESSWMRESKLALHRKLSLLTRENYGSLFKLHGSTQLISKVLDKTVPCVVDLSRVADVSVRKLYSAFFIKRIVDQSVSMKTSIVVIVEEAQNYLSRGNPVKPLCEMLREVRKFQVGLVIISQSMQQLVEDVIANTNTKIIHAIKSKQDLEIAERALYLDQALLSVLPYVEPGEAVYSTPSLKKPILIKIE